MDLVSLAPPEGRSAAELTSALTALEVDWRFEHDHDRAAATAGEVARDARAQGLTELALRADLVAADARRRAGDLAEAAAIAQAAQRWATDHGARALLARAHFVLGAVLQELGDLSQALEHAVHSVELLDDDVPPALQLDHRKRLADCLGLQGDLSAQDRYVEVLAMAEDLGDVPRALLVLNNQAYTASLAGLHEQAAAAVARLTELTDRHHVAPDLGTMDTIGRVLLGLGRLDEAEEALRPGLDPALLDNSWDGDRGANFLLTHAEVQRGRGFLAEARASLDECIRRCDEHGLVPIRIRARSEEAELHAATGDFEAAFAEHKTYTHDLLEQQSAQRDARARTLQAMYEATEARQQSRRYRELSLRDPLTGLYNRRHVDERLPALLLRGELDDEPVAVALLDLDHFKRVNDTCSHEVGDEVLRRVARMLDTAADAAPEGSFAARMGGEEFLLVLVGLDGGAAAQRFEQVRSSVAEHPWGELTQGLPVTISIGVAADGGAPGPAEVLARADVNLYRAKHEGRDRVVGAG